MHSGPIEADVQNMNSEQYNDLESAQSDGWVVDQNSFSSEETAMVPQIQAMKVKMKLIGPCTMITLNIW